MARRLRIAMLYTPLTTAGGAERQFLEEARQLIARGHDVTMLTFAVREEALFARAFSRSDITLLRADGGMAGQVASFAAALRRRRPDVLLAHTSPELTWLSTRLAGTPYVQYHNSPPFYIGEHANPYMASRRYRRAYPRLRDGAAGYAAFAVEPSLGLGRRAMTEARAELKHRAVRAARSVVVPSQRTVRELRMLHGVEATVVRGCLPSSLLSSPPPVMPRDELGLPTCSIVLSVSRLEPVKRIDLLLRAFTRVRRAEPDAALVIAGTGSDEARLRAIARTLDLGASVRFEGYVAEERLWSYYAAADVLAAPAMADFIIAPYEAMAMGARAVWSDEMETDAAIAASGQAIAAPPEEEAFATAIAEALRRPPDARADLSGMTWEARGERIERICLEAAAPAARMAAA